MQSLTEIVGIYYLVLVKEVNQKNTFEISKKPSLQTIVLLSLLKESNVLVTILCLPIQRYSDERISHHIPSSCYTVSS